jgi:glyoxylase-like metal-dependent hydrolase (beta-lactamase superfamily II)
MGDMTVHSVSDGSLTLPGDFIFGPMPQDELEVILKKYNQSIDALTPPCNVTLLQMGDRNMLFDVGSGTDFSPNAGIITESLDALGLAPEDITDIAFTHAHPDHLWGLLDDFDDPLFPKASYMIGRAEWDYWMNPNTVDTIGERLASFAVGAERRLASIADQISLIDDEQEILSGVVAHASFGHTPGHMSYEIHAGSESVMIIGDSIANHHVAFERPEWPSGSDQDRDLAAQTRIKLLDKLALEKTKIIGYHIKGNGIGYVERRGDAYKFIPEV